MQPDIPPDVRTPAETFARLAPLHPCFLLESIGSAAHARYSMIGFGGASRVIASAAGVEIDGQRISRELLGGLRTALLSAPELSPKIGPFGGGLVGVSEFDLVGHLYPIRDRTTAGSETLGEYLIPRSMLVFDHLTGELSLSHSGTTSERESLGREVTAALRTGAPIAKGGYQPASASLSRDDFIERVSRAKAHIAGGDVYQLVISILFAGDAQAPPFSVYRALRTLNPSPYMFYIDLGGRQIVGSSPEALVRLEDEIAYVRPIAGTRPRHRDPAEDRALEAELLADPKEGAEHVMLVDLARNDLGRTAVAGTVTVDPFRIIERYSHVMHLVSGVRGRLRDDLDAFDLFAATFPAGTVTGAPKLRAVELINELEPTPRGVYAGSVGYFGHGGSLDQAITIRTLVFEQGRYHYQAGAGIVIDSDPGREYREVLSKAAVLQAALDAAGRSL